MKLKHLNQQRIVATAYLSLGSNLGRRQDNLNKALKLLNECGLQITKKSKFFDNRAVSKVRQRDFLNICIEIHTNFTPQKLLQICQMVEKQMGRKSSPKKINYEKPRIIDIDILLYGNKIINKKNLKIPHKLMHKRLFVLKPLSEIAPLIKHPVQHKTIKELLKNL